MTFPVFKILNVDDPIISKLESNVSDVFSYLSRKQLIDGILLQDVSLSAAQANLVPHLLQRTPKGYLVAKKRPATVGSGTVTDIGTERLWPYANPPFGWLVEDGAAISRTTYREYFQKVSTTYGVGDGSTTFNLPDNRGRSGVGKTSSGTGSILNGTFGNLDFTVTIPAHYHGMGAGADLSISSSGNHSHGLSSIVFNPIGGGGTTGTPRTPIDGTTGSLGQTTDSASHTHGSGDFAGRIGLVTGGVNGNTAQNSGSANAPSFVRNWIVKVSSNAAFSSIDVWDSQPSNNLPDSLFLQLYSTIDCVVSIWVF